MPQRLGAPDRESDPALLRDGGGSAASYREVVRSIDMPTFVARDTIDKALANARHGRRWGQGSSEVVAYRLMSRGVLPGDPARLLADVRKANRESIDEAIIWLRLDPFCLWSGYLKRDLMRALAQQKLSTRQAETVRKMLLEILPRGRRQEFRDACRLARAVNSEAFRSQLAEVVRVADSGTAQRARWMLEGCERAAGC